MMSSLVLLAVLHRVELTVDEPSRGRADEKKSCGDEGRPLCSWMMCASRAVDEFKASGPVKRTAEGGRRERVKGRRESHGGRSETA